MNVLTLAINFATIFVVRQGFERFTAAETAEAYVVIGHSGSDLSKGIAVKSKGRKWRMKERTMKIYHHFGLINFSSAALTILTTTEAFTTSRYFLLTTGIKGNLILVLIIGQG